MPWTLESLAWMQYNNLAKVRVLERLICRADELQGMSCS